MVTLLLNLKPSSFNIVVANRRTNGLLHWLYRSRSHKWLYWLRSQGSRRWPDSGWYRVCAGLFMLIVISSRFKEVALPIIVGVEKHVLLSCFTDVTPAPPQYASAGRFHLVAAWRARISHILPLAFHVATGKCDTILLPYSSSVEYGRWLSIRVGISTSWAIWTSDRGPTFSNVCFMVCM